MYTNKNTGEHIIRSKITNDIRNNTNTFLRSSEEIVVAGIKHLTSLWQWTYFAFRKSRVRALARLDVYTSGLNKIPRGIYDSGSPSDVPMLMTSDFRWKPKGCKLCCRGYAIFELLPNLIHPREPSLCEII